MDDKSAYEFLRGSSASSTRESAKFCCGICKAPPRSGMKYDGSGLSLVPGVNVDTVKIGIADADLHPLSPARVFTAAKRTALK